MGSGCVPISPFATHPENVGERKDDGDDDEGCSKEHEGEGGFNRIEQIWLLQKNHAQQAVIVRERVMAKSIEA